MKKWFLLSLTLVCSVMLFACGNGNNNSNNHESSGEETINLKSADVVSSNSPFTIGLEEYYKHLSEETNGTLNIEHFPDGQLGNDQALVDGVKMGSIHMALVGTLNSPVADAINIHYLFKDTEHLEKVIYGDIGEELKKQLEEDTGLKVIGFVPGAVRHLTTSGVEVNKPEDLKGLSIRAPEMPVYVDTWTALGANPTPLPFTELFTSLQTGVVDGQENPYEIIANNSFYEVQDVLIETSHVIPARYLVMNKEKFESLSEEHQKAIEDNWQAASKNITKIYKENDASYKATLEENGMKIIKPDIELFMEATKEISIKYAKETIGLELYEKIQKLAE